MEDKQENLKELEQKDMENVRGQIKLGVPKRKKRLNERIYYQINSI